LPFLQQALDRFDLVPVLVGSLEEDDAARIASALRPLLSARTMVVVSSDFTHYGPNYGYLPFVSDVEENLRKLDHGAIRLILAKDFDGYMAYLRKTGDTICGRNAIAVLLKLLPQTAVGRLLRYDTSGRITGDFSNSVSYVSIAFTVPEGAAPSEPEALTPEEKKTLLLLARASLESVVRTGHLPDIGGLADRITPRLMRPGGAFVTLKKRGVLRGCIGRIPYPEAMGKLPPLYATVMLMAVESGIRDRRFRPVSEDELPEIEIEISVLSRPREIQRPEEFQVGSHGIIIRKGDRSAVYLPQVAPEQGWTRDETLCHLCQKAGLPPDEWKRPGMRFSVFTAQVFDESLLSAEEQPKPATARRPES